MRIAGHSEMISIMLAVVFGYVAILVSNFNANPTSYQYKMETVLARYSEDRRHVVVDMLTSFMQSYEAAQFRCPLLEMVRTLDSPDAIEGACAKAGGHLPFLPPVLTARRSAERIYTAINVEIQDPTLKFGVDVNVREQLIELRDRQRRNKSVKSKLKHRGDSNALSEDDGIENKTCTRVRAPVPLKADSS
ncbi:hypothetical protein PF001_g9134 [Phytophthora fragariae]|uniref:Uncharacterized protein n=1 Tax=Phytophthora fragariae TaxID=53985 RepID=A0A6A3EXE8_9STRA|nr:hypothetical protein PF009_g11905 [Phytophthora fragariae]KAE9312619.1 hypothetical protein PF001_g9134 [Phytophthora fragariae]